MFQLSEILLPSNPRSRHGWRFLAGGAAVLFLSSATGHGQSSKPTAEELKLACPTLAGYAIEPPLIGLPSGVATLTSAAYTRAAAESASGTGANPAMPEYCKVLGTIAPVDSGAQLIHFQINLPIAWNGKALQYGGGGFNGTLITGLSPAG